MSECGARQQTQKRTQEKYQMVISAGQKMKQSFDKQWSGDHIRWVLWGGDLEAKGWMMTSVQQYASEGRAFLGKGKTVQNP